MRANFAAYVPGDFPNPQLELLILLPQEARVLQIRKAKCASNQGSGPEQS